MSAFQSALIPLAGLLLTCRLATSGASSLALGLWQLCLRLFLCAYCVYSVPAEAGGHHG
jgi:hypothetical protein